MRLLSVKELGTTTLLATCAAPAQNRVYLRSYDARLGSKYDRIPARNAHAPIQRGVEKAWAKTEQHYGG